jgi:hypothetical protein
VPFTLGASLVVIYRAPTDPLRAIVVYDGGFTMDNGTDAISQTIAGFYQSSSLDPSAKLTMIVGDGQSNFSERVLFNGSPIATNPFVSSLGGTWDNPTFTIAPRASEIFPGNAASATVTIDHQGLTSFDCLTGGAFIFSTTVQDTDRDGLLDVWETTSGLTDPRGQMLPNLASMGANPLHKDVFFELGALWSNGWDRTPRGRCRHPDRTTTCRRPRC